MHARCRHARRSMLGQNIIKTCMLRFFTFFWREMIMLMMLVVLPVVVVAV